jgi:Protein of unknown function (DUF2877)
MLTSNDCERQGQQDLASRRPLAGAMPLINVLSLGPNARRWLATTHHPRWLHIFDSAANLINERKEVLSLVAQRIGNGPFNLVVGGQVLFSAHVHIGSPVTIYANHLMLGRLIIDASNAKPWLPRPNWELLHDRRDQIIHQLVSFPIPDDPPLLPTPLLAGLSASISTADLPASVAAARRLAGLGRGLTPAGDDFIMGAILAAWVLHPVGVAQRIAEEIANIAAPLTTSLSAAWLRCAGRGEAGVLWHNLLEALIASNRVVVRKTVEQLQAVGHTSGTDALAGFFGTLIIYAESEGCHVLLEHVR